jgi:hypothetical protein
LGFALQSLYPAAEPRRLPASAALLTFAPGPRPVFPARARRAAGHGLQRTCARARNPDARALAFRAFIPTASRDPTAGYSPHGPARCSPELLLSRDCPLAPCPPFDGRLLLLACPYGSAPRPGGLGLSAYRCAMESRSTRGLAGLSPDRRPLVRSPTLSRPRRFGRRPVRAHASGREPHRCAPPTLSGPWRSLPEPTE